MNLPTYSQLWAIQEPILAMTAIVELWLNFSGGAKAWRNATAEWWVNLQLLHWRDRTQINGQFLNLFNVLYGERMLSLRRFIVSLCTSTLFVLFVYVLLYRIGQSYWGLETHTFTGLNRLFDWVGYDSDTIPHLHPLHLAILLVGGLALNFLPDVLSISETGWIIRKASDPSRSLLGLFLLDILLTTALWLGPSALEYWFNTTFVYTKEAWDFSNRYTTPSYLNHIVYALTTYSTSVVWFGFVGTVLLLAFCKRASTLVVRVLEWRVVSTLPVAMIVGTLCFLAWPVLFVLRLLYV